VILQLAVIGQCFKKLRVAPVSGLLVGCYGDPVIANSRADQFPVVKRIENDFYYFYQTSKIND
jgi:hypothetical protein